MAGNIGVPANSLDLHLGQSPNLKDPQFNAELQGIYNAIHTLNGYTEALRQELEGTDSQVPSESLRFRKRFEAVAGQAIVAGAVVCPAGSVFINGMHETWSYAGGALHPNPENLRVRCTTPFIALTGAAAGETFKVGVPVGILQIEGAVQGQIYYAVSAYEKTRYSGALNGNRFFHGYYGASPYGYGALTPNAPAQGSFTQTRRQVTNRWRAGDWIYESSLEYWPVGICVRPGFVLIKDWLPIV